MKPNLSYRSSTMTEELDEEVNEEVNEDYFKGFMEQDNSKYYST